MTRFLIYLFPALIDMALGCVMLVAPVRMAAVEGSTALAVTMLPMAWAACYSVVCWIIRLIVNKRNAAWLTVAGSAGIALTAVLFIVYPQPMVMYTLMVPQAISTALFFVPFQVFMKSVEGDHDEGVVRSTALYTASWSVGLGAGPFVAGWMMTRWGWQSCMLLNIAIGLATAAGILLLKHHAYAAHDDRRATPSDTRERGENDYGRMPDLAWLGWVGSGVGFVVMAIYSSLLPKEAEMFGIPAFRLGIILATASWVRALMGVGLLFSRRWMYRPGPVAAFGLFGVASMILFAVARHQAAFFAAAVCFGIYSGAFCFYFVFHSLVHPKHSAKYVSINEAVVGVCTMAGPFLGGLLADLFSFATPYLVGAVAVLAAVVLQATVHRKHARASIPIGTDDTLATEPPSDL